jgi:hypothetical protein
MDRRILIADADFHVVVNIDDDEPTEEPDRERRQEFHGETRLDNRG